MVLSAAPLAIVLPSGLNATLVTPFLTLLTCFLCPVSVRRCETCADIPETDSGILTPACDSVAIWAKRHAVDSKRMSGERAEMYPRVCIPETDGGILTPACDSIAIRTKRYAVDRIRMPSDQFKFFTCLCVVDPNTYNTYDCQTCAVWRNTLFHLSSLCRDVL